MEEKLDYLTKVVLELGSEVKGKVAEVENGGKLTAKKLQNLQTKIDLKLDMIERQLKRNNLVFMGIDDRFGEADCDIEIKVLQLILNKLQISCRSSDIDQCYRLGKKMKTDGKNRPICVRFLSYKKKREIFSRRHMLRGSRIFIHDDFTKEVRQKRFYFRRYLRENDIKGRVSLNYDKLIINGVLHTAETLGLGDDNESQVSFTKPVGGSVPSPTISEKTSDSNQAITTTIVPPMNSTNLLTVISKPAVVEAEIQKRPIDTGNLSAEVIKKMKVELNTSITEPVGASMKSPTISDKSSDSTQAITSTIVSPINSTNLLPAISKPAVVESEFQKRPIDTESLRAEIIKKIKVELNASMEDAFNTSMEETLNTSMDDSFNTTIEEALNARMKDVLKRMEDILNASMEEGEIR